jgi:hypothetical protein
MSYDGNPERILKKWTSLTESRAFGPYRHMALSRIGDVPQPTAGILTLDPGYGMSSSRGRGLLLLAVWRSESRGSSNLEISRTGR